VWDVGHEIIKTYRNLVDKLQSKKLEVLGTHQKIIQKRSRKTASESVRRTSLGQGPMGTFVNSQTRNLGKNFLTRRKCYQLIKEDPAPCC
jgi:hypothetical protein